MNIVFKNFLYYLFVFGILAIGALWLVTEIRKAESSAPTGYETEHATSSTITATNADRVAFATTTGCTARVLTISTQNASVRVKFADSSSIALSATVGHRLTASSSPYTFDSGLFGCGQLSVFAESGTPVLQVTEFRGFK